MALTLECLELRFTAGAYGLSARRLWEHTELGQINVFSQAINARRGGNGAAAFIDVVRFNGETFSLVGFTLADFREGKVRETGVLDCEAILMVRSLAVDDSAFVRAVAGHLERCSIRQATRNQHHPFLPCAHADDAFGVPHVFSTLQRRLQSFGKSKATTDQWLKTIDNFQQKGLRTEELECSKLLLELAARGNDGHQLTASELANKCNFRDMSLSVIPVISDASRQLRFTGPTAKSLTRTKNVSKALAALPRSVVEFDPVLGYRIERVEHQTLWGLEHSWQAVTYGGEVIRNVVRQSGFQSVDEADALAASHAKQHFPKRVALGRFGSYAWTGGETYREWLITLPHYPASYLSGHFKVRNVLAHVRCDVREGADGERVLILHEVQSDWAQRARRAVSTGEMNEDDEVPPPFMKEWPALAMKLIILHAANQQLDAVAWTRGAHQVFRFNGLGAAGLVELYDRTLPREVNRMMKPFGMACEPLGVFVPTNFSIRQTENGYEVYSPEDELLGIALTLEEARQFVPDQGHELLYEVHGVRLPEAMRATILDSGFPAWG